jgi:hypothetical protein
LKYKYLGLNLQPKSKPLWIIEHNSLHYNESK